MASPELRARLGRNSGLLLAAGLLLGLACCPSDVREALLLRRGVLVHGQVWRLWTGHWVHFGWSHLVWDVGCFVLAGVWLCELGARRVIWQILVLLAPLLSLGILLIDPKIGAYGGLSGLVCAEVAVLSVWLWRTNQPTLSVLVSLALALKLGAELLTGQAAFTHFEVGAVHSVPLAHQLGTILGLMWAVFLRKKSA